MADIDPPGDDVPPAPAGDPDWWTSTEQSPFSKLSTTASRPSASTSSVSEAGPAGGDLIERTSSTRTPRLASSTRIWSFALIAGAGAMIAGSLSSWFRVKNIFGSRDVTGVADASLGWITLIAAIVVAVAGLAIAAGSAEPVARRFFSLSAGAAAGAAFATPIFTLVQQTSGQGVSVGWGLILVLAGSIAVLAVSFVLNVAED